VAALGDVALGVIVGPVWIGIDDLLATLAVPQRPAVDLAEEGLLSTRNPSAAGALP
jgi:hypothetical protein